MKIETLVTVDWDFFCAEDLRNDFGHQESLLFLNAIWKTRAKHIDTMRTSGDEKDFWQQLRLHGADLKLPLWVSDSHAYATGILKGIRHVVIFDAHHDCFNGLSAGQIDCGNWLRHWLKGHRSRRATWVRPSWQEGCELPEDMEGRVNVVDYGSWDGIDLGGWSSVHVCRSGCWTPPWLDGEFLQFLDRFVDRDLAISLQDGQWNPLTQRWNNVDFDEAREFEKNLAMAGSLVSRAEEGGLE